MSEQLTINAGNAARLIIVEVHPIVREGLRVLLGREAGIDVCGDVGTVSEALAMIDSLSPDLVLVDVLLEDENGFDLICRIKTAHPTIKILVCSMFDERLYAERAIAAGAMGYVNSRAGIQTIVEAIFVVMAGGESISDRLQQHIFGRRAGNGSPHKASPIDALSNRELEIFRLMGHGLKSTDMSELLTLSASVVEAHLQNIRLHLQHATMEGLRQEAARWVRENDGELEHLRHAHSQPMG